MLRGSDRSSRRTDINTSDASGLAAEKWQQKLSAADLRAKIAEGRIRELEVQLQGLAEMKKNATAALGVGTAATALGAGISAVAAATTGAEGSGWSSVHAAARGGVTSRKKFFTSLEKVDEKMQNKIKERCEKWRDNLSKGSRREPNAKSEKLQFLTAVVIFRSYAKDPAKLTSRELKQWILFMFYAGVDHVFVYHAYHPEETQGEEKTEVKEILGEWIKGGYVSYYDWSKTWKLMPFGASQQVPAYTHCIETFRNQMEWQVAVDMDEYPFSETDVEPDFLRRAVSQVAVSKPSIAEIAMQNYLMVGAPLSGDNPNGLEDWLAARHQRLCCFIDNVWQPGTHLVKPIYRLSKLKQAGLHHNSVDGGVFQWNKDQVRQSHFWGGRLDKWANYTSERILKKTDHNQAMLPIVDVLRNCPALDEASEKGYAVAKG